MLPRYIKHIKPIFNPWDDQKLFDRLRYADEMSDDMAWKHQKRAKLDGFRGMLSCKQGSNGSHHHYV